MSFAIPGYFHDLKTNKYYRITPTGPYSLPELRKRLKREKEEEEQRIAAANIKKKPAYVRYPPAIPKNINGYLQQRSVRGDLLYTSHGTECLFKQLSKRSSVKLSSSRQAHEALLVEATSSQDSYGELFIAESRQLHHFGFQLDPQLQIWHKEGPRHHTLIHSLRRSQLRIEVEGQICQPLLIAEDAQLCCLDYLTPTPLLKEEIEQYFWDIEQRTTRHNQEVIRGMTSRQYKPIRTRSFIPKRDMLWSVDCTKHRNQESTIVAGGDRAIYHLNAELRLKRFWKVKSSVFTLCMAGSNSSGCWIGYRNGQIKLHDFRQKHINGHDMQTDSSICQIQVVNDHEIAVMAMNGSVTIWDQRQLQEHGQQQPLQQMKGFVDNENINRSIGFDIDPVNGLVAASGIDGHVRIWSLSKPVPIWTSRKYKTPVPALKLFTNPDDHPRLEDCWTTVLPDSPITARKLPGLLLFGTDEDDGNSKFIDWYASLK